MPTVLRTCLLVALLASGSLASLTGFKATLTNAGVDHVKNAFLPGLIQQIGTVRVPDQSTSWGSSFWKIEAYLTDIYASDVRMDIAQSSISCAPPSGLTINGVGLAASIRFRWGFSTSVGGQSGDGGATSAGSTLTGQVALGADAEGRPTLNFNDVRVSLNNLDVHIDAGILSQVLDWFIGTIKGMVKGNIEDIVAGAVRDLANQMSAKELSTLSVHTAIPGSPLAVDYGLSGIPSCAADYIVVPMKGAFYNADQTPTSPPVPAPAALPDYEAQPHDVLMFISEYVANTAQYVYWEANALNHVLTQSDIPSDIPLLLNTNNFDEMAPDMAKTYPNHEFQLECGAESAPINRFRSTGLVEGSLPLQCLLRIMPEQIPAFRFHSLLTYTASLRVEENFIRGKLLGASTAAATVTDSTVGTVDADQISSILEFVIPEVTPRIQSSILDQGVELPHVAGMSFASTTITVSEGLIRVISDPQYSR
eukprot:GILK01001226.1.p1 GENE.GILK01001226.1~~GILK01001226.1.p1  ORF type:complete len:490 (+),score=102.26 GILK01001226.1:33-1472(+)